MGTLGWGLGNDKAHGREPVSDPVELFVMSISHFTEQCRAIYQTSREKGAPAVIIRNMGGGFMCGETSDGQVLVEGITGCCKWCMKFKIAQMWHEKQNKI